MVPFWKNGLMAVCSHWSYSEGNITRSESQRSKRLCIWRENVRMWHFINAWQTVSKYWTNVITLVPPSPYPTLTINFATSLKIRRGHIVLAAFCGTSLKETNVGKKSYVKFSSIWWTNPTVGYMDLQMLSTSPLNMEGQTHWMATGKIDLSRLCTKKLQFGDPFSCLETLVEQWGCLLVSHSVAALYGSLTWLSNSEISY